MNRSLSISQSLAGLSGLALGAGATAHMLAYPGALTALEKAHMGPFMGRAFAGLWLSDSLTLALLAVACLWLAWKPDDFQSPLPILLIACCLATAIVLFMYMGVFFASYVFAAVTVALITSTVVARRSTQSKW